MHRGFGVRRDRGLQVAMRGFLQVGGRFLEKTLTIVWRS